MTKFGNGDVDDVVDDVGDGRGRVKYAQTDNSDDPDPLPGPKVVRKAGWMGRWLVLELLLVADLAAAVGLDDVEVALSTLAAADAVAVATTATAVAVVLDADEARAVASAIICDAVVVKVVLL